MSSTGVTKENFIGKIQAKLKEGDIIGKIAYGKVKDIISNLRIQLADAQSGSNEAIASSKASVEAARAEALYAKKAQQEAADAAKAAEDNLNEELMKLRSGEKLSSAEIENLQKLMSAAKTAADEEVAKLQARITDLEGITNQLTTEKEAAEGEYVRLFNEALITIDDALENISDISKIGEQSGGFQSSSSGNYDYKKYRSSSRSYSNKIKGLKKKRKQSKKERKQSKKRRRDRKKKSKHNKTRKH